MPVYRWLTEVSCYKWSTGANSLNPLLLWSFGSVPSSRRGTKSCFDHLSFSQNLAILCIGVVAVLCIETVAALSIEIVAGFDATVVVCMKLLSITCTVDHCVCCSQWLLLALGLGGGGVMVLSRFKIHVAGACIVIITVNLHNTSVKFVVLFMHSFMSLCCSPSIHPTSHFFKYSFECPLIPPLPSITPHHPTTSRPF